MSPCDQPSFLLNADVIWIESDAAETELSGSGALLTISQVSAELAVTPRTLRFYESRGLVSPRREEGVRLYDRRDIDRLALILKAKRFGFKLAEIAEMVKADEGQAGANSLRLSRTKCLEQIDLLERQLLQLEDALTELRGMHTMLSRAGTNSGRSQVKAL